MPLQIELGIFSKLLILCLKLKEENIAESVVLIQNSHFIHGS